MVMFVGGVAVGTGIAIHIKPRSPGVPGLPYVKSGVIEIL